MNGCQLSVLTNAAPPAITISTTATFTTTMTALTFADSLMPMTISAVTARVMSTAGRLTTASRAAAGGHAISVQGADAYSGGMAIPTKSFRKLFR